MSALNRRNLCFFSVFSLLASTQCSPPFEQPALVISPRVIALIASRPTVAPGDSVTMTAALGDAMGVSTQGTLRWSLCARPEVSSSGLPLSSFGAFEPDIGCNTRGTVQVAQSVTAERATFTIPPEILQDEPVLLAAFGDQVSAETRRALAQSAGITLIASLTWTVNSQEFIAFKRVLVHPTEQNTNPPTPWVTLGGRAFRSIAREGVQRCEPTDGNGPHVVAPMTHVVITPDTDEAWVEPFERIDASGQRVTEYEAAFRNWFSTAGAWDFGRARAPDLAPTWVAPRTPGTSTLWLVLRDGHGGTSACIFTVLVR
ncbi:MAG: hypothetical protein Q8Q09_10005 [Deltaproteobacteria bacterium]|nr:hypothetical protein [Deltaproteobacteria bacterium]